MIEIKDDYMIDDAVTAAKAKYAEEMGFVNKMEYRLMEPSVVGNGQVVSLPLVKRNTLGIFTNSFYSYTSI